MGVYGGDGGVGVYGGDVSYTILLKILIHE